MRSIYNEEVIWKKGRLSVYFLCGNANKIYLDALCNVMPASSFADSRMSLWPEFPVEYTCPESSRQKGISVREARSCAMEDIAVLQDAIRR